MQKTLFDGFSSNAVISIIAVMIIGAGLDKTGLMSQLAAIILKYGGKTEKRIIPIISSSVGIISSFMQNVGAAALYIPVVSRISSRTDIPLSRLLMPMGFCAILGGTLTMVGSSPLILLNDLILTTNENLPIGQKIPPFFIIFSNTHRSCSGNYWHPLLCCFGEMGIAWGASTIRRHFRTIYEGILEKALWFKS